MMFMVILPILLILLLVGAPETRAGRANGVWPLALLFALPILGGVFMMGGGGMMGWGWGYGSNNWMGIIFGLVVMAGLVWLGYLAFRRVPLLEDTALETLRLRLARGEITPEEFAKLRGTLLK